MVFITIRKRIWLLLFVLSFLVTISGCSSEIQNTSEWPAFHGVDRSNKSNETDLIEEWPKNGPDLLWTVSGLTEGYSSLSIGGGLIYTAGLSSNQTFIFCFDLQGNPVWRKPNGDAWSTTMSWAVTYTGARSTPTYDNGLVYHLGERGRLTAFDARSGSEKWHKELMQEFEAEMPEYGYSESVLIDGDNLYVRPAGKKGFQVCLNKNTGDLIWANSEIPGSEGYTSAVLMDFGGYHQILGSSSNCHYGIDTQTGKLLWRVDFENARGLNITDPVVHNEYVFLSSGYGKGSMLIKLLSSDDGVDTELVWESNLMDNHHGGIILHDGYLFGSGSNSKGWFCLDFPTGKQMWNADGKGSLTYADGMLYMLDERSGTLKLVKAIPDRYEQKGEFAVPSGGEGMYWAHPVVSGGRLYIRHADKLYAYDVGLK